MRPVFALPAAAYDIARLLADVPGDARYHKRDALAKNPEAPGLIWVVRPGLSFRMRLSGSRLAGIDTIYLRPRGGFSEAAFDCRMEDYAAASGIEYCQAPARWSEIQKDDFPGIVRTLHVGKVRYGGDDSGLVDRDEDPIPSYLGLVAIYPEEPLPLREVVPYLSNLLGLPISRR